MKKKIVYGALSLIVIIAAIGFSNFLIKAKPEPKKDNKSHNVTFVKAEKVNYTELEGEMSYRGRVTAFDKVSLSAEVSGKILQGDVRFKTGERFRKGQVIVNIYSEDVEAALKSSKSSFLQTISSILPDMRVDYSDEYEKWMNFFNAIDVEKPLPELPVIASDKEKVFLAANNVLASYYTLLQQEINLARYIIRAPFNGSFKMVNKEIGAVSSPGSELATIIRTDKLEVTVPVFPSDLDNIKEGEKVIIVNRRGVEKSVSVARISDFVDASTQSINVYLTYYESAASGFLEGEYVDVIFNGERVSGFELPREALFNTNYVYVLQGSKLEIKEVTVLRQLEDSYIIAIDDQEAMIVMESMASISASAEYKARN
jgi:membrane fusion protein (multidrug efflux system)